MEITDTTTTITKLIPVTELESVEKEVKRLNRVAKRNGFEEIQLDIGDDGILYFSSGSDGKVTFIEVHSTLEEWRKSSVRDKWTEEAKFVTVNVPVFGFEGYRLVGLTENVHGVDVLFNFEEEKFNFDEHRGTCKCDHCGHNRRRDKVYFVANESDEVTLLGSSCVQKFFPKESNALHKFKYEEGVTSFLCDFENEDAWGSSKAPTKCFDPVIILSYTLYIANKTGYVSKAKSQKLEISSTTEYVKHVLCAYSTLTEKERAISEDSIKYKEEAERLIEWSRTQNGVNSYFDNVINILDSGFVPERLIGYIVGIYGCYQFANQKKVEKESENSKWIGELAQRREFVGKVVRLYAHEGFYGVTFFHTIETEEGVLVYKKSNGSIAEEGDTVSFMARIKEHSEFNGVKQTLVERPTKIKIV